MADNAGVDSTVKLCLQAHGTDGSTNIVDKSQNRLSITAYGSTHISTEQSRFAIGRSIKFNGVDDYLLLPTTADLSLSGEFGIGFFIRFNTIGSHQRILTSTTEQVSPSTLIIRLDPSNTIQALCGYSAMVSTTAVVAGVWYYVSLSRDSSNLISLGVNGNIEDTLSLGTAFQQLRYIGGYYTISPTEHVDGYLDDIIIRKDVTIDGTVPTTRLGA